MLRSHAKNKLFLASKFAAHGPNPSAISPPKALHHRYLVFSSSSTAGVAALRSLLRSARSVAQPAVLHSPSKVRAFLSFSSLGVRGFLEDGARALRMVSLQKRSSGPGIDLGRWISSLRYRWRNLMPTGEGMAMALIGANVGVFFLWKIADPGFMRRNFMVSIDNLQSWRLHTLITNAFSHTEFMHLLTNMITLYFFGKSLGQYFGPNFLLKLYVAGALAGSIFFLAHKALKIPSSKGQVYRGWDESRVPALGASGAVNSIILLYIFLFPRSIIYFEMLIPLPAALLGGAYILTDLWRAMKGDSHISGEAHLGGAVVAALWWYRIKKGRI